MVVADGAPEEFQVNGQLFGVNPLVARFVEPAPPCTQRAPCQLRGSVGRLEPAAAAPVEDALQVLELLGLVPVLLWVGRRRCLLARHLGRSLPEAADAWAFSRFGDLDHGRTVR